ncbi:MAG: hypothetical protein R2752_00600 [Vicinamibacterales bacterium]
MPRVLKTTAAALGAAVALSLVPATASAQYFGRNKVQYRTFDFQILETEHFDLYYYQEEAEAAHLAARMAERWYGRLSRFFGHQLRGRQAVILYAVPSHFRQTNAIEGLIGEGTGGVTEALKRRIVLPMSGSLADTDHVLGHELVHAFQFDITGTDPRESDGQAPDILFYPLWFVEGMAEYLTLGSVDSQTAMWMRDAALREKLPDIKDLDKWEYFPYRWGHAFWSYIGAKYGDRAVASLLRSAANPRTDLEGLARQLGTDPESLTRDWHQAILARTREVASVEPSMTSGIRRVIGEDTGGGRYNVGPRISPDGRRIAFFSERDRFSVDLYVADAETGKIERRLLRSATDPHFDSLEFLNSAGAWSPDGRQIVIATIQGGRPTLAFVDADSGLIARELTIKELDDALNPTFTPDGRSIVLSGNKGGLIDLYRVTLESGALEQLTSDPYADLEPVVTPDGATVIFVTERFSSDLETLERGPLRLARLDLATHEVHAISGFLTGKHLSPQVSPDGTTLTFVAEPDGVSNLYRMPIEGGPIEQLTSVLTGIAGITTSSPTLSASSRTGRLAFSVFENGGHAIYVLDADQVVALVPDPTGPEAAVLPGRDAPGGDIQRMLDDSARALPPPNATPPTVPYAHGLTLDMVGQPTVTAGVGEFGGFVVGSVSAFFSDMLGDRALGVSAQVAGSLADFGGAAVYVNRRHRWNWAVSAEQWPYRSGYLSWHDDPAASQASFVETIERQTNRGGHLTAAYPFNTADRLEVGVGARAVSFTRDVRVRTYSTDTRQIVDRSNTRDTIAPTLYLAEASAAFVHDTSFYGATSPVFGSRYRLQVAHSHGSLTYTSALVDWRRYFMPVRPVTIAVRGLHFGRYGPNAVRPSECLQYELSVDRPESCVSGLADLYLGYPELIHGYGFGSFSPDECFAGSSNGECQAFTQLLGSRMLVANIEVRAPLVGLFKGELDYGRVPIEVAGFFDAGVAWTHEDRPTFLGGTRRVVRSVGAAARVNVFGLLTLEVAASRPLDRLLHSWQWQIGVRQGF